ncbi:MAG: hypothetical protein HQL21_07900 [Candidatus Omnitrophica bacterium]|nr:hypothetical protein [Candidatus Omnitrophota bacterium]
MKHLSLNNRAQNMIEYAVLFAAVVAVLIMVLRPGGSYSTSVNDVLKKPLDMIDKARSQGFQ